MPAGGLRRTKSNGTRSGLSRVQTKIVHQETGNEVEMWHWNGCPSEDCHAPTFMTTENGYCVDCNTKYRRMKAEKPRGNDTVMVEHETWRKNGVDCNPLKTWETMRESANLNAVISKMSLDDLVGALKRPAALKALDVQEEQVENLRNCKLNGYDEIIPAFVDGLFDSARLFRRREMDFFRLFKPLQQVKDEVFKMDNDLVAQALIDDRGSLLYGDMPLPGKLSNKSLPASGILDAMMKKDFLVRLRASIQFGKRLNFANLLRLAAYEINANDADMRAMLALQVAAPFHLTLIADDDYSPAHENRLLGEHHTSETIKWNDASVSFRWLQLKPLYRQLYPSSDCSKFGIKEKRRAIKQLLLIRASEIDMFASEYRQQVIVNSIANDQNVRNYRNPEAHRLWVYGECANKESTGCTNAGYLCSQNSLCQYCQYETRMMQSQGMEGSPVLDDVVAPFDMWTPDSEQVVKEGHSLVETWRRDGMKLNPNRTLAILAEVNSDLDRNSLINALLKFTDGDLVRALADPEVKDMGVQSLEGHSFVDQQAIVLRWAQDIDQKRWSKDCQPMKKIGNIRAKIVEVYENPQVNAGPAWRATRLKPFEMFRSMAEDLKNIDNMNDDEVAQTLVDERTNIFLGERLPDLKKLRGKEKESGTLSSNDKRDALFEMFATIEFGKRLQAAANLNRLKEEVMIEDSSVWTEFQVEICWDDMQSRWKEINPDISETLGEEIEFQTKEKRCGLEEVFDVRAKEIFRSAQIYKDTFNKMLLSRLNASTTSSSFWSERSSSSTRHTTNTVITTQMRSQFSSGMEYGWESFSNEVEGSQGEAEGKAEGKDASDWSMWVSKFSNPKDDMNESRFTVKLESVTNSLTTSSKKTETSTKTFVKTEVKNFNSSSTLRGKEVLIIGADSDTKLQTTAGGRVTVLSDPSVDNQLYENIGVKPHVVDQTDRAAVDKFFNNNPGPYDHVICSTVPGVNGPVHIPMPMAREIENVEVYGAPPPDEGDNMSIALQSVSNAPNQQPLDLHTLDSIVERFHRTLDGKKASLQDLIVGISNNAEETIQRLSGALKDLETTTRKTIETEESITSDERKLLQSEQSKLRTVEDKITRWADELNRTKTKLTEMVQSEKESMDVASDAPGNDLDGAEDLIKKQKTAVEVTERELRTDLSSIQYSAKCELRKVVELEGTMKEVAEQQEIQQKEFQEFLKELKQKKIPPVESRQRSFMTETTNIENEMNQNSQPEVKMIEKLDKLRQKLAEDEGYREKTLTHARTQFSSIATMMKDDSKVFEADTKVHLDELMNHVKEVIKSLTVEEETTVQEKETLKTKMTVDSPTAIIAALDAAENAWSEVSADQSRKIEALVCELQGTKQQLSDLQNSQSSDSDQVSKSLEEVKTALSSNTESSSKEVMEKVNEMKTSWTGDLSEINNSLEEIVTSLSNTSDGQETKAAGHAKALMEVLEKSRELMKRDIHDEDELNTHRIEREEVSKKVTVELPAALRKSLDTAEAKWQKISDTQNRLLEEQASELAGCKKVISALIKEQNSNKEQLSNSLEEVRSSLASQSETSGMTVMEKVNEMKTLWTGELSEISDKLEEVLTSISNASDPSTSAGHADNLSKSLKELKELLSSVPSEAEDEAESTARETMTRVVTVECPDNLKKQLSTAEGEWKRLGGKQNKVVQEQAAELEDCKKQLNELRNAQKSGTDEVSKSLEEVKTALSSNTESSSKEVMEKVNEMKTSWTGDLSDISDSLEEIVTSLSNTSDGQITTTLECSDALKEALKNIRSLIKVDVDESSEEVSASKMNHAEKTRSVTVDCPNDVKARLDAAQAECKRVSVQQNKIITEQADELTELKKQLSDLRATQSTGRNEFVKKMMTDFQSMLQSNMDDHGSSVDQQLDPLDECSKRLDTNNDKLKSKVEKFDESYPQSLDNVREGIEEWTKTSVETNELFAAESNARSAAADAHKEDVTGKLDDADKLVKKWTSDDSSHSASVQTDSERIKLHIEAVDKCKLKCDSSSEAIKDEITNTMSAINEESASRVSKSQHTLKEFLTSLDTKLDSIDECVGSRVGGANNKLKTKINEMETAHGNQLSTVREGVEEWAKKSIETSEQSEEESRMRRSAADQHGQKIKYCVDSASGRVQDWKDSDGALAQGLQNDADRLKSEMANIDKCKQSCEDSTETVKEQITTLNSHKIEESSSKVAECEKGLQEWDPSRLDNITIPENEPLLTNAREMSASIPSQMAPVRAGVDAWSKTTSETGEQYLEEETTRKALMDQRKSHLADFINDASEKVKKWESSDVSTAEAIQSDADKLLEESKAVESAKLKCDSSSEHMQGEHVVQVQHSLSSVNEESVTKISECDNLLKDWASQNVAKLDSIKIPESSSLVSTIVEIKASYGSQLSTIRDGVDAWRRIAVETTQQQEQERTTRTQSAVSQQEGMYDAWREAAKALNQMARAINEVYSNQIDDANQDLNAQVSYGSSGPNCEAIIDNLQKKTNDWANLGQTLRANVKVMTDHQRSDAEQFTSEMGQILENVKDCEKTVKRVREERDQAWTGPGGMMNVIKSINNEKVVSDIDALKENNAKHAQEEREADKSIINMLRDASTQPQTNTQASSSNVSSTSMQNLFTKVLDKQIELQKDCLEAFSDAMKIGEDRNSSLKKTQEKTTNERSQLMTKASNAPEMEDKTSDLMGKLAETIRSVHEDTIAFKEEHHKAVENLSMNAGHVGRGSVAPIMNFETYGSAPVEAPQKVAFTSQSAPPGGGGSSSSASCVPPLQSAIEKDVFNPGGYAVFVGDIRHGEESAHMCSQNENLIERSQLSRALVHAQPDDTAVAATTLLVGNGLESARAQLETQIKTRVTYTSTSKESSTNRGGEYDEEEEDDE